MIVSDVLLNKEVDSKLFWELKSLSKVVDIISSFSLIKANYLKLVFRDLLFKIYNKHLVMVNQVGLYTMDKQDTIVIQQDLSMVQRFKQVIS